MVPPAVIGYWGRQSSTSPAQATTRTGLPEPRDRPGNRLRPRRLDAHLGSAARELQVKGLARFESGRVRHELAMLVPYQRISTPEHSARIQRLQRARGGGQ